MSSPPVDVLIFEDTPSQVQKIADWLGLAPYQYASCPRFAQATPTGRHPDEEAEQGWRWIAAEVRRVDPKVVVFDYLLSKNLGNQSYDGLFYGNRCKDRTYWPEMGVVLVTTGGDHDQAGQIREQEELDKQRIDNKWAIDFAWIKPWGAARSTVTETKVQADLQKLIRHSRRPSEHKRAAN
jgi:hypothetical protein